MAASGGGGGGGTDQRKGETIKSAPLKGSWACSGDDSALVDFRKEFRTESACGPCGTKIIFDDDALPRRLLPRRDRPLGRAATVASIAYDILRSNDRISMCMSLRCS